MIIRAKLDLMKLTGAKKITAKDGIEYLAIPLGASQLYNGEKGVYLDASLLENRDGVDSYGNNFMIVQDIGKERREAGDKGAILGNGKFVGAGSKPPAPAADDDEDSPF